jgi:hypothetical protein
MFTTILHDTSTKFNKGHITKGKTTTTAMVQPPKAWGRTPMQQANTYFSKNLSAAMGVDLSY